MEFEGLERDQILACVAQQQLADMLQSCISKDWGRFFPVKNFRTCEPDKTPKATQSMA